MKVLLLIFILSCSQKKFEVVKGKTMGTTYVAKIKLNKKNVDFKKGIEKIFHEINAQMSTYLPNSEISKFNKLRSSQPFEISKDFLFVLNQSKMIFDQTDGEFDPSVMPLVNLWGFGPMKKASIPSQQEINKTLTFVGFKKLLIGDSKIQKSHPFLELDLSAVAKGYAIDKVVEFLDLHSNSFLVELGGEVFARGMKDDKLLTPWVVGIEKPSKDKRQTKEIIELKDECIATSGDYRNYKNIENHRFSHLIDLKTGKSKENDFVSVSIIAPTCLYADALATASLVAGKVFEIEKIRSIVIKKSSLD